MTEVYCTVVTAHAACSRLCTCLCSRFLTHPVRLSPCCRRHTALYSNPPHPTGRYVATAVTSLHGAAMENGFNMWSFNGKLLYSMPRDRFQQLSWRPRVPSLLSKEKEEEIKKNLKEYSRCGLLVGACWGRFRFCARVVVRVCVCVLGLVGVGTEVRPRGRRVWRLRWQQDTC